MVGIPGIATRSLDRLGLHRDGRVRSGANGLWNRAFGPTARENARPFTSFSQHGEDAILNYMLEGRTGNYIDVGAGHPIRWSNTYALYERGWRGHLIEPIPSNVELARRLRPEDDVRQACAGRIVGEETFYEYGEYLYSTMSRERATKLGVPLRSYSVPVITLASLGVRAGPTENFVLSVDVEGLELEVLEGNDWDSFQPGLIVIEEWDGPLGKETPVLRFLRDKSYVLIGIAGVSSIYRHQHWEWS